MLQGSDLELNPFLDEGSEIHGFGSRVSLVLQSNMGEIVCVVNVAMDNKWGTAASGTASPFQPSQASSFILLN